MATKRSDKGVLARLRSALPVVRRKGYNDLVRRYDELYERYLDANHVRALYETWVPPGHFYSPYPDPVEVAARAGAIFDEDRDVAGIDLRADAQLELLKAMAELAEDLPFPAEPDGYHRYYLDNPAYAWADGIALYTLLRHIDPARIIEVGSGYSSALLLDAVDRHLDRPDRPVEVRFIEPYPDLLHSLLREGDRERITIDPVPVQDVPLDVFDTLEAGDVLFIDSTHVVKAGSDVGFLFFEVLPRLPAGVWVHIHDMFWPFEYPRDWVDEGRAWQEVYLVRAFLMNNPCFEIRWFQDYMWKRHRLAVESALPDMAKNPGGNLWLHKVA